MQEGTKLEFIDCKISSSSNLVNYQGGTGFTDAEMETTHRSWGSFILIDDWADLSISTFLYEGKLPWNFIGFKRSRFDHSITDFTFNLKEDQSIYGTLFSCFITNKYSGGIKTIFTNPKITADTSKVLTMKTPHRPFFLSASRTAIFEMDQMTISNT